MNLIKIDLRTIKKNPNAGETMHHIPGRVTTELSFWCASRELLEKLGDEIRVASYSGDERGLQVEAVGAGEMEKMKEQLDNIHAKSIQITQKCDVQTIHSMIPEPSHHYKYLDTKVECEDCGVKIRREKIIEESNYDYEEYYDYNVCPNCRGHNTFNFRFEKITEALEREEDA